MDHPPGRTSGRGPYGDGLNEDVWSRLVEIVSAANRGDADAHFLAISKWPEELPLVGHQRAAVYLLYLLYRQVRINLGGRRPTPEDLHDLTGTVYPRFREILTADALLLEEAFRAVFELPPLRVTLKPGERVALSSAALGVLMVDPAREMGEMRPGLASWLRRNQEKFRAEGLLDDPSGAERP
jgi:hypothetical protein